MFQSRITQQISQYTVAIVVYKTLLCCELTNVAAGTHIFQTFHESFEQGNKNDQSCEETYHHVFLTHCVT